MKIIYVGVDTHKNSNTVACYEAEAQKITHSAKLTADRNDLLRYLAGAQKHYDEQVAFVVGYEAGCMGYELKRFLDGNAIECHIMAPSTIASAPIDGKKKSDRRDAEKIAHALAYGTYKEVYMPTPKDEGVRDYIRMRDDHKQALGNVKRQILALCLRHNLRFTGTKTNWTKKHLEWLRHLDLKGADGEALAEYLITYEQMCEKLQRMDRRIAEFAKEDDYRESVEKLCCLKGIGVHTALSLLVEIGDFSRFEKAGAFAAFLGLVPGQHSSGENDKRLPITKAGNTHLRRLLTEAVQALSNSAPGYKSAALKKQLDGQSPEIINYCDRANLRIGTKIRRMTGAHRPWNVAITAGAREMACFIWGLMTEHTSGRLTV